jgi:hypothetical protein
MTGIAASHFYISVIYVKAFKDSVVDWLNGFLLVFEATSSK